MVNGHNGDALSARPKQRISGGDLISGNQATTCEDQVVAGQSEYPGTAGTGGTMAGESGFNSDTIRLDDMRHAALCYRGIRGLKVLQTVIATLVCDNGRLVEAGCC